MPNKDKEQIDDKSIRKPNYLSKSNNKGETEMKQTSKDLDHARKVCFDLIQTQNMVRTKWTVKKG